MARSEPHISPALVAADRAGLVVAAAVLAAGIGFAVAPRVPGTHGGDQHLDLAGVALLVAGAIPLVWWRQAPSTVFVVAATAAAATATLDYPLGFPVGATAALYLLASSRTDSQPWRPSMTAAVAGLLALYLAGATVGRGSFPGLEFSHTALAWAVAWFAGERTRLRHQHLAELQDRAERAERDAERDRQLAISEERALIARDLHDSAGHAVNVIAVQAGAARLRHPTDPERARQALAAIEQVARDTAADIDHIVAALRDTTPTPPSPIRLTAIDTLITQHATAGLTVTHDQVGTPQPMTAATDQSAYRIIQEALTNAARHGTGTAVLTLTYSDTALEVTVTNPVTQAKPPRQGGGHGLVGMQERARAAGGTACAHLDGPEFRVTARLPYGTARS